MSRPPTDYSQTPPIYFNITEPGNLENRTQIEQKEKYIVNAFCHKIVFHSISLQERGPERQLTWDPNQTFFQSIPYFLATINLGYLAACQIQYPFGAKHISDRISCLLFSLISGIRPNIEFSIQASIKDTYYMSKKYCPFLYSNLLLKMGNYFLDIQYTLY